MLTVTDLFCGAGGSSSGAEAVPGVRVRMAANHWDLAIETHNHNMPHVDHDIADIEQTDPRRYPSTDLLWASPSCTFWSQAAGRKVDFDAAATAPALFDLASSEDVDDEPDAAEAKERSRALMHDVPRFAEYHRYKAVIVENTLPLLKWVHFPRWIARMRALGYRHQVLSLNSAFAHQLGPPAPQLRDRAYIAFWSDVYPTPDWDRWTRPQAWCPTCEQVVTALRAPKHPRRPHGAYWQQYYYRCPAVSCRNAIVHPYTLPAASIVDWADPGIRIGDRSKHGLPELKPKTLARIESGLHRFAHHGTVPSDGSSAPPPLLVPVAGRDGKTARPAAQPMRAQTGRNETGMLVPAGGGWNQEATSVSAPMRTRTTRETEGVVLVPLRNHNRPKHPGEPLDTVAASGNHHGLLMRNNSSRGTGAEMTTPTSEPARTITTTGHQSLLWHPNAMFAYDTGHFHQLSRPLPTQTTVTGDAVAQIPTATLDDCRFRMLTVDEIKTGMAFEPGFVLLGSSKRNKVRMCGNAVTPPVPRDLIAALVEAITGHLEPLEASHRTPN